MIEVRQPGKSTYIRDMVVWIFEPDRLEKDLMRLVKKFGKQYMPMLSLGGVDLNMMDTWTKLGPHGSVKVWIYPKLYLSVGCYRDGWHIKLDDSNGINFKMREEIFGDANRNHVWTKETAKVPHIMGKIYEAVKGNLA